MTNALMDIDELKARASGAVPAPAGGRPAAATLTLGAGGAALPSAAELAELLPRVPVAGVRFADTADFSALPGGAVVRIVALLRECSSVGARVGWTLELGADQHDLINRLDHLPAPGSVTVGGTLFDGGWRSAGTFGLFYFRKGPKFLSVTDQRPESARRFVIDDPALIEVFLAALEGCPWADVTGDARSAAAARDLVDRGLLMRAGDHCVTLPVHMRNWPLGSVLLGGTLASAGKTADAKE